MNARSFLQPEKNQRRQQGGIPSRDVIHEKAAAKKNFDDVRYFGSVEGDGGNGEYRGGASRAVWLSMMAYAEDADSVVAGIFAG